ncbi:serine hydrolase domain-containing protein [Alteromonas sediminis]|nr:serine hydrolase domain-containing protein [Alteromonas sediminis]
MKRFYLFLVAVVFLASCDGKGEGPSVESGLEGKSFSSKMDHLFEEFYANNKFMGSVSVTQQGRDIYSSAFGYSDIDSQTLSNLGTKYRGGSITKMFTSALVLKAVEDKKLSLDMTVEHFFPSIVNAPKITIRQLLNHRSGIPSFTKDPVFWKVRTDNMSPASLLSLISEYQSNFEPDSSHEYSNSNYFLLSQILERVYQLSYAALLQREIAEPLALQNTYSGQRTQNDQAYSYVYEDGWKRFPETDLSIAIGSGDIVTTPKDLNVFIRALFEEQIISADSLNKMTLIRDNVGLGLFPFSFKNINGFGHGGTIDGFHSISIYFPEEQLVVSIMSNAIDYNINTLFTHVLSMYFNEPFEFPNFDGVSITAKELEKYVGMYKGEGPGKFTITLKEGVLHAQLNDSFIEPLIYLGNHKFTNEETGAHFIFDPEANTLGLEQSGVADIYMFNKQ